ncbi:YceD family protein [Corynebacterium sp. 153RC1]|uniref:YceD family protein n=1 Tax=unclassified Corynebacterium TaxID=2624378 RepID=UPI00211C98A8|nr:MULTISPECIES: YceD family protein [unclassified Corynebacterium]MCQ9370286.1 YceD family protein [Corynebacterium sp. 35RC1]MCQ9351660.1 YceD family protein [Corynebacterium sp. 209RC1]MCQ9354029.1 YceD family protein [Corynebacterium sp. 1222RC1]MCQ9355943.1 YceD family protein [Corynebacterium sp. 122RC1]MCQ9358187.1 YceD family protein [Corynebacterium sp. 142RC1]
MNPFVFEVGQLLRSGMPETLTQEGPAPQRIGPAMIAIPEGAEVRIDAALTPLGEAVMADATLHATLQGQCSRCLTALSPEVDLSINEVFAASEDFIQGEAAEEDEDELPVVLNDTIDLLQSFLDEAGLNLPFNPVCEGGCEHGDVPEPDGVSGETQGQPTDPRWAGLEKFL